MQKLIRDNIPEIIKDAGEIPIVRVLDEAEYLEALKAKLLEESNEVRQATSTEDMLKELADLQEVVHALLSRLDVSMNELETVRHDKAKTNGAFSKKLYLERVDQNA